MEHWMMYALLLLSYTQVAGYAHGKMRAPRRNTTDIRKRVRWWLRNQLLSIPAVTSLILEGSEKFRSENKRTRRYGKLSLIAQVICFGGGGVYFMNTFFGWQFLVGVSPNPFLASVMYILGAALVALVSLIACVLLGVLVALIFGMIHILLGGGTDPLLDF